MLNASMKSLAVELLLDLVKTYSPTYREDKAIRVLEDYTRRLKYNNITIDSTGNLIAEIGSGDKSIALVGHIDTVRGYIKPLFNGNEIIGRGVVDAKGPLAAMTIAGSIASNYIDTSTLKIILIASVGEEGSSYGARSLLKTLKADYIIVGEPTNITGIAIGCKGSCRLIVKCNTTGGHTANPELYISACREIIEVLESIEALLSREYTITPTYVRCGSSINNIIPKNGIMIVNIRIPIGKSIEDLEEILHKNINTPSCTWMLRDCSMPFKTSPSNTTARAISRALAKLGLKPRYVVKSGTSDMTILSKITNNIAENGPGAPELSHTDNEAMSIDDYIAGIRVYANTIIELYNMIKLGDKSR
ncbi:MAG: M20/M25/M40 family metallo-hydrolase [Acidilobaceae archaeon]